MEMNNILSNLLQQVATGRIMNNPLMAQFNQMMGGKTKQQQIQTLLNSAKSKGIDINAKQFSEQDLKMLGLK